MKRVQRNKRILAVAICVMVCLAYSFIAEETTAMAQDITSCTTKTGERETIEGTSYVHTNDLAAGSTKTTNVTMARLMTRNSARCQTVRNAISFIFAILFKIALIPSTIFMIMVVRMPNHNSDRAQIIRCVHRKDGKK